MRQTGMSISEWLILQGFEKEKRREDQIKRVTRSEKKRMRPVLTKKARETKPQYLDQYIKQKLSLESIPETASSGGNILRKESIRKGALTLKQPSATGSKKNFIKKYTANEKSV